MNEEMEKRAAERRAQEWVTFKADGKGSISEFRKGEEIHHGADRGLWPPYIQHVFERMYDDGGPLTTPISWSVTVEDLKSVLAESGAVE
jgi:hypothetical protein